MHVPYSLDVETEQPDEQAKTQEIVEIILKANEANEAIADKYRHGIRDAHAKIHGVLVGELQVYPDLPEPLAQGLFAEPASYPVIARLSSAPGDLGDDKVPTPRGMAVKVIGVPGRKLLPGHEKDATQDFLMVTLPTLPFGDVDKYLDMQKIIAAQANTPDTVKQIGAAFARGAKDVLAHLGMDSSLVDGVGVGHDHILGQTFHTMAALRYGDYIAKISAAPLSPEVKALTGVEVPPDGNPSRIRDSVVDFFRDHGAEYELRAQLCTDLDAMPVEDASVLWKEEDSPHQPVAKLVFPAQDAYKPSRRVYADDVLEFNPWHAIEAHQPLGSIMRCRIPVYESSAEFRHGVSAAARQEPRDTSDIPDGPALTDPRPGEPARIERVWGRRQAGRAVECSTARPAWRRWVQRNEPSTRISRGRLQEHGP